MSTRCADVPWKKRGTTSCGPLTLYREYRRQFRAVRIASIAQACHGQMARARSPLRWILHFRSAIFPPIHGSKADNISYPNWNDKSKRKPSDLTSKGKRMVWHVNAYSWPCMCLHCHGFLGEDLLGEDIFGRSLNPNAQTRLLSFIFPLCLPTQRHCTHIRSLCSSSVRS